MVKSILVTAVLAYSVVFSVNTVRYSDVPTTATYLIETADGFGNGSGVLISPNTLLTARHVADVVDQVPLFVGGKPVSVIKKDDKADLALLHVEGLACPCAPIGDSVEVGDHVIAAGFPMHALLKALFLTQGVVTAETNDFTYSQAAILPGNSGGGLFHRTIWGVIELVGINVSVPSVPSGFFSTSLASEYNMSIPIKQIREFLGV